MPTSYNCLHSEHHHQGFGIACRGKRDGNPTSRSLEHDRVSVHVIPELDPASRHGSQDGRGQQCALRALIEVPKELMDLGPVIKSDDLLKQVAFGFT